jgi:gluconokinase
MARSGEPETSIVVVMGVAGAGKTTIGMLLANALGCAFVEGDLLHPKRNIEKMARGIPLTDSDRAPWLAAVRARLLESVQSGEGVVIACSALKQAYREFLANGIPVAWVYLKGSEELIRSRLLLRREHYMRADMLASQFEILEEPADAIVCDVSLAPDVVVKQVLSKLRNTKNRNEACV